MMIAARFISGNMDMDEKLGAMSRKFGVGEGGSLMER